MPTVELRLAPLDRVRSLTLSKQEFGGQIVPKMSPTGECRLECKTRLIEGTGMDADDQDVRFYARAGDKKGDVMVASTPFYREVFDLSNVCLGDSLTCNIFFHTHGLLMYGGKRARLSPPSIGDFVAHCFLGNLRNAKENKGQRNTMVVAAFEGVYVYDVTDEAFAALCKRVEEIEAKYPAAVAQQMKRDPKELAPPVLEEIKEALFDELTDFNAEYFDDMYTHCDGDGYSIAGAKEINAEHWRCQGKECKAPVYEFEFARRLRDDPEFVKCMTDFIYDNAYTKKLNEMGFYFKFYPWHQPGGIHIDVNVCSTCSA